MTPAQLIQRVCNHGGQVAIDGSELVLSAPRPLPTDLLHQLRSHKAELVRYLTMEASNSDPAEWRRQEVLAMLARDPTITRVIITDDQADGDFVIGTFGLRDVGTCELRFPRARYEGLAVLELIDIHNRAEAR